MKLENSIFEEEYHTSFTHVGIHNVLTNKSFLALMENLAGAHSAYCHFTFSDLEKHNLSWIIINWKLQVMRRPKADEVIKIQTWIRSSNRLFVFRDFKVFDSSGTLCAIATSKWSLIDTTKGKIAKMPETLSDIYHGFLDKSVFEISDLPKLKEPETQSIASDYYKIRRFDLDLNKHVHNLNYLNFAYEVLPISVFDGPEPNNLEVYFRREIKYGDTIKSFLHFDDGVCTVAVKSDDLNTLHAIVKLY